MPRPIQDAALTKGIRESFGIQGPQEFELDELVSAVAIVRDLREGPQEIAYAGGARQAAGGAGNRSIVALANPPGSGIVVRPTLVSFTFGSGTSGVALDVRGATTFTAGNNGRRKTLRPGVAGESLAEIRTGTQAFAVSNNSLWRIRTPNSAAMSFPLEGFLILPGAALALILANADEELIGSWQWTEFQAREAS